jgi:hypothetical protein
MIPPRNRDANRPSESDTGPRDWRIAGSSPTCAAVIVRESEGFAEVTTDDSFGERIRQGGCDV